VAERAGLSEGLFEAGRPFVAAQLQHPTVKALEAGQLPDAQARSWLEQDYLFLQQEIGVLTRLAWQAPREHQEELLRLAWNVVDEEIPGHRELCGLFGADLANLTMAPVTRSYGTGLAALLSGLWGYSTLGQRMALPSEPRFRRWVASYQAPEFDQLAQRFADMLNEADPDPDLALCAFLTGMAHEMAFWAVP
jgi:thiaminase (transcriptional activator TenA)